MPVEDADFTNLTEIRGRLARTTTLLDRWQRIAAVNPKSTSEWGSDQEATRWWTTEMSITAAMHHASDALNTLNQLLAGKPETPLPYVSHFAVARSGLEAASLAVWLLEPDDPRERISRHLREVWREVVEENKLYANALEISKNDPAYKLSVSVDTARKDRKRKHRRHIEYVRKIAKHHRLEDPTNRDYSVGFREITGSAAASAGISSTVGELVWSDLSSLSHPSTLRTLRSDVEVLTESDESGMREARVSTSIQTIGLAVYANLTIFSRALALVQKRKIQPADIGCYSPPRN